MRILFSSHAFAPSVGGLESVSRMLAEEFVRQGHEVRLITQTTSDTPDDFPFRVWRRPSGKTLPVLVRWCEVFFHSNISLPRAWPLLLIRRPWVVAHHVWIPRREDMVGWLKAFLKRAEQQAYELGETEAADLAALDVFLRKKRVPVAHS